MSVPERAVTRIFIIGDNTLFREGMAEICGREPDLSVVGLAAWEPGAIEEVARSGPDVVLLSGGGTPNRGTEELVGRLAGVASRPRLVMLATHENVRVARRFLAMGVWGYVANSSTRDELLGVIRTVGHGENRAVLSVPRNVLEQLTSPVTSPLSPRELEVIELVAAGLSNAQVAARLHITMGTVKRHLTNTYLKLDVRSRTAAINKAAAMGLLDEVA